MGKIKDEIIKAIDIIIDTKLDKLNFDRTYIGIVSEVLPDGYTIKYNGTEITIKETVQKYKKGDTIKFCMPCNNKKNAFIL